MASFLAARVERSRGDALLRIFTAGRYMDHHVAYGLVRVAYAQLGTTVRPRTGSARPRTQASRAIPGMCVNRSLRLYTTIPLLKSSWRS